MLMSRRLRPDSRGGTAAMRAPGRAGSSIAETSWVDRPTVGCHQPRPGSGGLRFHRKGQPARGHPAAAAAGLVLRHRLPTQQLSGRYCAAGRRSVPPLCGWQPPPPAQSRRPRSQLPPPATPVAAIAIMIALRAARRTSGRSRIDGAMVALVTAGMRVEVWNGDASHGFGGMRPGRARR